MGNNSDFVPEVGSGEAIRLPEFIRQMQAQLVSFRRDIHAHPELAFKEVRTAERISARLTELGVEHYGGIGGTGIVAVIDGEACPRLEATSIGLRADMDALPILERNEFAHRSVHQGCMHACGHDGHTTVLLGAVEYLVRHNRFAGTVYAIFQPAEEGGGGARKMLEDGLLKRFPMRAVFGLHNWPELPPGKMAVHSTAVMASEDSFDIEILGHGGHAAMPEQVNDPVVVAASLVTQLQSVVSRNLEPVQSGVVSVTMLRAGEAYNVIPERALLCGTVRALSAEVRTKLHQRIDELCAGMALAYKLKIECRWKHGYPPTVNTPDEAVVAARAAKAVFGKANVEWNIKPSMGAEDFAYFLEQRPGCYVWLGNGGGVGGCMLHNPRYDFNDDIIGFGVAYWGALVQELLPLK